MSEFPNSCGSDRGVWIFFRAEDRIQGCLEARPHSRSLKGHGLAAKLQTMNPEAILNAVHKSSGILPADAASTNSHTVAQHCEQTAKVAVAPMQAMKAREFLRFRALSFRARGLWLAGTPFCSGASMCWAFLGPAEDFREPTRGWIVVQCTGHARYSDPTFWLHREHQAVILIQSPEHTVAVNTSGYQG